jgi:protocatechuate 3,4-dioxygenase alpha subunit
VSFIPTASQTVGPFFNFALTADNRLGVIQGDGERIRIAFRVIDGEGNPTPGDSMIELWQPEVQGFARLETDSEGRCVFETVKPADDGEPAPYITVLVFARGLLKPLHTRLYFADDPGNASDPVLCSVPEARRGTLVARLLDGAWHMEIRLQGDGETVFFDV